MFHLRCPISATLILTAKIKSYGIFFTFQTMFPCLKPGADFHVPAGQQLIHMLTRYVILAYLYSINVSSSVSNRRDNYVTAKHQIVWYILHFPPKFPLFVPLVNS
jgi:hypothetical protein